MDQVDGLRHQRNLKFCWLSVGNVASRYTMICVIEIDLDYLILFGINYFIFLFFVLFCLPALESGEFCRVVPKSAAKLVCIRSVCSMSKWKGPDEREPKSPRNNDTYFGEIVGAWLLSHLLSQKLL